MLDAETELLALGSDAIPILDSLLTGTATNEFGVPYRNLGLPLRCVLEVAIRLGTIARPLEPLLREELRRGDFVAAQALGVLGAVDEDTIEELAAHLDFDVNKRIGAIRAVDLTSESAIALIRLGHAEHPAVLAALKQSPRAASDFARMMAFVRQSEARKGA
jgi:hypothetical protein